MILTKSFGQDHFVSYIDFDNSGQFAWQIEPLNEDFLLSVQTNCFSSEGSCGGVLKLNSQREVLNHLLLEEFSGNPNNIVIDSSIIYLTGEFNENTNYSVYSTDLELSVSENISLRGDTNYYGYFQVNSVFFNGSFVTGGNVFLNQNHKSSLLFNLDDKLNVESIINLNPNEDMYSSSTYQYFTSSIKNELIIFQNYRKIGDPQTILEIVRLDSTFNRTFEWSLEVEGNSIPRGCVKSSDDMIISVPEGIGGWSKNIYSIDTLGQTNWIWEWDGDEILKTNILRIDEARNGDLFVMGQVVSAELFDGDIRNTAFVMRLSSDGKMIWRRFLKIIDPDTRLSNYVSDLVELDNGDLQLTGQSRRIVLDHEIGEFRPDQDILWARIGGDGCINGDCSEVYLVSNTDDLGLEQKQSISIYPNPIVDDQITIDIKDHSKEYALIYNLEGKLLKKVVLEQGKTAIALASNDTMLLIRIVDKDGRLIHSEKVVRL